MRDRDGTSPAGVPEARGARRRVLVPPRRWCEQVLAQQPASLVPGEMRPFQFAKLSQPNSLNPAQIVTVGVPIPFLFPATFI